MAKKKTSNHFVADEGKSYYRNGIAAKELYLGCNDSIDNWELIDESEAAKRVEEERQKELSKIQEGMNAMREGGV